MSEPRKRRTEITIETHQLTIIRIRRDKTNFHSCRNCGQETIAFNFADAALIFSVKREFLEQMFQNGQIHSANDKAICGSSLADYFKREIRYLED